MTIYEKPQVGISSCLMGELVRYNGGHQRDNYIMDTLSKHVRFVPLCPEMEAGMSVPRPAVRLVRDGVGISLRESGTGADHTEAMRRATAAQLKHLKGRDLDGFIFKRASPSCGLAGVKVYQDERRKSQVVARGVGLFAEAFQKALPSVAVAEEGWLKDDALRRQFLHRIFTSRRLKMLRDHPTLGGLQQAHAEHKLLYMAHHPGQQRTLGQNLASLKGTLTPEQLEAYHAQAQALMKTRLSRGKNVNVLQHMFGYVSKSLSPATRQHALRSIQNYAEGRTNLQTPLTLVQHLIIDKGAHPWLEQQVFLNPFPAPLR